MREGTEGLFYGRWGWMDLSYLEVRSDGAAILGIGGALDATTLGTRVSDRYGAGIDSQVVYGTAGGGHAWNQVKIDGNWYMVDSTWDDPEYSSKKETAFHPYFNVSDEYLSLNHKWMNEGYNACTTMKDNYFNHYGYVYSGQSDYESALKERIKEGGSGVYESVITDSYSVDNAFVREVSGGRFSEYYNDILNDYYFSNVIVK